MRLRELPGIPGHYLDFVEYTGPAQTLFSCRPVRENLRIHAAEASLRPVRREAVCAALRGQAERIGAGSRALENIRKIGQQGSVVVLARIPPGLFGGPLYLFLKCLTAVRLAGSLESEGLPAVPVCWVGAQPPPLPSRVQFVDVEGRMRRFGLPGGPEVPDSIGAMLAELDGILTPEQRSSDSAAALRRSYTPGTSLDLATRRLLSEVTVEFGAVVLDPQDPELRAGFGESLNEHVVLSAVMPVAAIVVDAEDLLNLTPDLLQFDELQLAPPLLWPHLSATLVDARSRKILEKHDLGLRQLLSGREAVLRLLEERDGRESAAVRIDRLLSDIDRCTGELTRLSGTEDGLVQAIGEAQAKMKYQLDKIRQRYLASVQTRREAAARQIERVCTLLFPEGGSQERGLGGMHFVLRYSRGVLREILEKGDFWSFDHQAIGLD